MDIQLPQILFQIVNFGVVMGALTYLLYKPVQKIFSERTDRIAKAQKAAEETISEKNKLGDYTKKVKKEAEKKAKTILDEASQAASEHKQQVVAATKEKARTELEKLQKGWSERKTQLLRQTKQEMVEAVITVSEKIIAKKLDKGTHSKMIDAELKIILASL